MNFIYKNHDVINIVKNMQIERRHIIFLSLDVLN